MSNLDANLQKYANLLIKRGVNLQKGQEMAITATIDCAHFARIVTAEAYKQGARFVTVRFVDEAISRMHYENCDIEVFETFPEWQALLNNGLARKGACTLLILSEDPMAMLGIDQNKLVANTRAAHEACKEYYDTIDMGKMVWCIAGAASPKWAKHVFADLDEDLAIDKLWEAIFKTARVDTPDPLAAWDKHRASFKARSKWLNDHDFDALHYSNSLGTDLVVGLNKKGFWKGGGDITVFGIDYFPNIPTEEIFTTPDFNRCDGVVYSSMPLVHNGAIVDEFSLTFKDGVVASHQAKVGSDVLAAMLSVDAGAKRLGECALVPYSSPIQQSGILFYNTLYDENASCHLAIGKGFPDCLDGGTSLNGDDELTANGINVSATHVDFMIGTPDLSIDGIKDNGIKIPIFRNGDWAI